MFLRSRRPVLFLCLALQLSLHASGGIIQLRIVEGEGAVHASGSRSTRPLTVQVTDETGKPVEGATVSFLLPHEGPSGAFANGLGTELLTTRADGRASVTGIQWNHSTGALQVRITAKKDDSTAGTTSAQYLSDAVPKDPASSGFHSSHSSRTKWVLLAAVAAGAAGGLLAGRTGGSTTTAATSSVLAAPQIGAPTLTIGQHP